MGNQAKMGFNKFNCRGFLKKEEEEEEEGEGGEEEEDETSFASYQGWGI